MCRLPTRLPSQSRLLPLLPELQQGDLQWGLPPDEQPFPQQSQDTNDSLDDELLLLLGADSGESGFAGAQLAYVTGADALATQPDSHTQQAAYVPEATKPRAMFPSSAAVGPVLHDGPSARVTDAPFRVGVAATPLPATADRVKTDLEDVIPDIEDVKPAAAAATLGDHKPPASAPRGRRRNKTPQEIQAQIDRVKKRRRESAQRSRQRKSVYVHTLEDEVAALRTENARLRSMLGLPPEAAMPPSCTSLDSNGLALDSAVPGMDALFDWSM